MEAEGRALPTSRSAQNVPRARETAGDWDRRVPFNPEQQSAALRGDDGSGDRRVRRKPIGWRLKGAMERALPTRRRARKVQRIP